MTAILGARRAVPFARCYISPDARAQALEVMLSGWMTTGARTLAFEQSLAEWIGAADA